MTNGIMVFLPDNPAVNQCVQYLRDHKIYVRGNFEPTLRLLLSSDDWPQGNNGKVSSSFRGLVL